MAPTAKGLQVDGLPRITTTGDGEDMVYFELPGPATSNAPPAGPVQNLRPQFPPSRSTHHPSRRGRHYRTTDRRRLTTWGLTCQALYPAPTARIAAAARIVSGSMSSPTLRALRKLPIPSRIAHNPSFH